MHKSFLVIFFYKQLNPNFIKYLIPNNPLWRVVAYHFLFYLVIYFDSIRIMAFRHCSEQLITKQNRHEHEQVTHVSRTYLDLHRFVIFRDATELVRYLQEFNSEKLKMLLRIHLETSNFWSRCWFILWIVSKVSHKLESNRRQLWPRSIRSWTFPDKSTHASNWPLSHFACHVVSKECDREWQGRLRDQRVNKILSVTWSRRCLFHTSLHSKS